MSNNLLIDIDLSILQFCYAMGEETVSLFGVMYKRGTPRGIDDHESRQKKTG